MARHNDLGKKGENLAVEWLKGKGFEILCRNWRFARNEVDIIATRSGIYHFIEVKTGSTTLYGHPEEKVSSRKIEGVMKAAVGWLHRSSASGQRVQYDVLAVSLSGSNKAAYLLIEDVHL